MPVASALRARFNRRAGAPAIEATVCTVCLGDPELDWGGACPGCGGAGTVRVIDLRSAAIAAAILLLPVGALIVLALAVTP